MLKLGQCLVIISRGNAKLMQMLRDDCNPQCLKPTANGDLWVDVWSVFPGNQMPVQPGPSGDEEDGVGCLFYLASADVHCPFISSCHNSLAAPRLDADMYAQRFITVSHAATNHTSEEKG